MGIPWDGTGINCYGMGQINMSHGQPCEFPQQRVVVNLNTSLKNSYLMKYISLTLAFELGFSKRKIETNFICLSSTVVPKLQGGTRIDLLPVFLHKQI